MANPSARLSISLSATLFLLSAATLAYEINLSRLFSVAQFYHFAFMIVSIALLGFGASGTFLALLPGLERLQPALILRWLSLATGGSMLAAYLLINAFPFDSFSIAWDRRQVFILILDYLALALPFFCCGLAVSQLLAAFPQNAGRTYALNLFGSACGCALALWGPELSGGEGMVAFSSGLAALGALVAHLDQNRRGERLSPRLINLALAASLVALAVFQVGWRALGRPSGGWFELRLSPYKALSYALQHPGAQVIYSRWNAFSRIDLVRSASIHSFPGLSYRFLQPLPVQDGILVDGDDLSPLLQPGADTTFASYLASSVAYRLKPDARVLILEPRGGRDIVAALALGARSVTAVEVNPLIVEAAAHIYRQPGVTVVIESERSYLRAAAEQFDLIVRSLTTSYHPVRSGAYSLSENYRYTIEAFLDALAHLQPDGILVVDRWLQSPPSECLRAFALAVTALERSGYDPAQQIVALRGYNTATLLIKKQPFNPDELSLVRQFAAERAFDLIYAPDVRPDEVNQYNILPEPVYYQAFVELLQTKPRQAFYRNYQYDVSPPDDDRPFFGHYFKWSQAPQVLAEFGKTWQPFGGAGYFVLLALLGVSLLLSTALILLPVVFVRLRRRSARGSGWKPFFYFAMIGLAYLLVEIPLIQRFILYLGQPAYAMTAVLFSLLLFSGLGSRLSSAIPARLALGLLILFALSTPWILPRLLSLTLGFRLSLRLAIAILTLAPLGFLMGIPFPAGIRWLTRRYPQQSLATHFLIPWVWAVNGTFSVVASVLAALLALTFGYSWVLMAGVMCYAGAWLMVMAEAPWDPV